jgi:hypothetical protein
MVLGIRNILGIGALLALLTFAGFAQHWRIKAAKLDQAVAERDRIQQEFIYYKATRDRLEKERDAASEGYQDELQKLRAAIDRRPVPAIRLCPQSAGANMPAAANAAAGPEESAAAARVVSGSDGLPATQGADIGPGIGELLNRADELSAQLRAILALEEAWTRTQ